MINKIIKEEVIGFSVIGMLFIACLYLYTESPIVQRLGMVYGLLVFILTIGFLIKIIIQAIKGLYNFIKSKRNK
ncbi:hypothetical protein ABD91_00670 [Lysinibacillus sphaericus]|nr:hypothetical protein [Lysinibacillus sphaericus]